LAVTLRVPNSFSFQPGASQIAAPADLAQLFA
jgi:hypothetical protein